jgi:transcriptional regulator
MSRDELALLKGTLEMLVLKALSAGEPLHGFEILDWLERGSDSAFIVEEGALYPALHRMQKRGWLRGEWGISEKGRRARYYRLTDRGREALRRQDAEWDRYVAAVSKLTSLADA